MITLPVGIACVLLVCGLVAFVYLATRWREKPAVPSMLAIGSLLKPLMFVGAFAGVFALALHSFRGPSETPGNTDPHSGSRFERSHDNNESDKRRAATEAEYDRRRAAAVAEGLRKQQAHQAETAALLKAAEERDEKRRKEALSKELIEKRRVARAEEESRASRLAAIALRDKNLLDKCASMTDPPRPIRVGVGDGTLEVSCPHRVLYMVTEKPAPAGSQPSDGTRVEEPQYLGGGSSLHLSATYTIGGKTDFGKDHWFNVDGRAAKLSMKSSDEKVLKAEFVQTIFRPVGPGEATVTVTLADESVSIPVLVVPLDIAPAESTDAVIGRLGLPDDDLFVVTAWPHSKTVHNLRYYDNLRGTSRTSAHHWKFNNFPGAVVVVDGGKVVDVSTTTTDYVWPKEEERRFRESLRR